MLSKGLTVRRGSFNDVRAYLDQASLPPVMRSSLAGGFL